MCVHPFRVGLPPGRYASAGEPLPDPSAPPPVPTAEALELPEQLTDLEGWLVATLRTAEPDRIFAAVARAERGRLAVRTRRRRRGVRRVLSTELARR